MPKEPPNIVAEPLPAYTGQLNSPQPQPHSHTVLIVPHNACPLGGTHMFKPSFTPLGICLAVLCFPPGIICCLLCTKMRCVKCGEWLD
ncbi:hypothetical protein BC830DRAFT_1125535 [Chytriomyces sp. MP71]|nr:hypothetical protein BC830DRAFT_1125535 [Chytriomyces sp. MP71]